MRSKDLIKQEFKKEILEAMQSEDEDAMVNAFVSLAEKTGSFETVQELTPEQSMKVNSIKEVGIKAAKMSKRRRKKHKMKSSFLYPHLLRGTGIIGLSRICNRSKYSR